MRRVLTGPPENYDNYEWSNERNDDYDDNVRTHGEMMTAQ